MIIKKNYNRQIVEATCDMCGADCMNNFFDEKSYDGDRDDQDNVKQFEGLVMSATWGYTSNKDGEQWEAVICEKCVDEHLSHIPFVKNYYL